MPGRKFIVYGLWFLVFPLFLLLTTNYIPSAIYARYTPNDAYQEKRASFDASLTKIKDPVKVEKIKIADEMLYEINQKVCNRFEEDVNRLAAIMEEVKVREGITETRVAFGGYDTPIKQADYWVNYAAEAVAFQKIQDYTPNFSSESQLKSSITSSMNELENDLEVLKGKILRAKTEVGKILK